MMKHGEKLFLLPCLVLGLIVLFSGLFLWQLLAFSRTIRQENLANIQVENRLVGEILREKLLGNDIAEAMAFCENFDRKLLRLTLIKENGEVIADSDRQASVLENHLMRQEVQNALSGNPADVIRKSETTGLWMTYYAETLDLPGSRYVVRCAVATDGTARLKHFVMRIFWIAISLGALFVLLLAWYVYQRIRKPLVRLHESMERISGGDLDTVISVPIKGIVRPIALNVTRMAQCLKSRVESLHRMEAFRREFLSNVSHELKTPLTSIVGATETLQESGSLSEAQKEKLLSLVEGQSQRMNRLLEDILSLAALECRQEEPQRDFYPVDVMSLLEQVVDEEHLLARDAGCDLHIVHGTPIELAGDAELLREAVANLVVNAIKYSGSKSIELESAREQTSVVIRCIDHGIGVSLENRERIFERFYRVSKERSRKLGGTGLGLAIVKHIVQLHNGKVECQETPGGGATFVLVIPIETHSDMRDEQT